MRRQRGQALILLIIVLEIGAATAFYTFYSPTSLAIRGDELTGAALAQARDARIEGAESVRVG
jgi:hypothetical protein